MRGVGAHFGRPRGSLAGLTRARSLAIGLGCRQLHPPPLRLGGEVQILQIRRSFLDGAAILIKYITEKSANERGREMRAVS